MSKSTTTHITARKYTRVTSTTGDNHSITSTQCHYTINTSIDRKVKYSIDSTDIPRVHDRSVNQHSKPTWAEGLEKLYCYIITHQKIVEGHKDNLERFHCWESVEGTRGFHINEYNRFRVDFFGKKMFTYIITWMYHHPKTELKHTISHLCSNPRCHRPSHLVDEPIDHSRDRCSGHVCIHERHEWRLYCTCDHTPVCKKASTIPDASKGYEVIQKDDKKRAREEGPSLTNKRSEKKRKVTNE